MIHNFEIWKPLESFWCKIRTYTETLHGDNAVPDPKESTTSRRFAEDLEKTSLETSANISLFAFSLFDHLLDKVLQLIGINYFITGPPTA
jgi:hypothetical protein